jgi:hypothetical protein
MAKQGFRIAIEVSEKDVQNYMKFVLKDGEIEEKRY